MITKINSSLLSHSAVRNETKPTTSSSSQESASINKQSKAQRIAAQIAEGSYKLDMHKTAKAVADALI